jgi:hypothetical protein
MKIEIGDHLAFLEDKKLVKKNIFHSLSSRIHMNGYNSELLVKHAVSRVVLINCININRNYCTHEENVKELSRNRLHVLM